jgi:glyoxylase-like metal-dependent hydrolase (beta-lactamase superfamily II)
MHFDHTGAANYFPEARLLIQEEEYKAAFLDEDINPVFDFELYKELADNPVTILNGDHDVFGDGLVKILAAPGHTPGHQVLFINLAQRGPIVLSGDLYHFQISREQKKVPLFNTDPDETLRSMKKIERFIEKNSASLWIEHDLSLANSLPRSPNYIR